MICIRFGLSGLLFLALARPVSAQSVLETIWSDLRAAPGDIWYVWSAPARLDGDDVAPLLLFTGATALVAVNDLGIQEWIREHEGTGSLALLEPFRSDQVLSHAGQNHWVLRGAAVLYVIGLATGKDALREAALGCATGNTANALPRKLVYALVSRPRPSASDDPYDISVPGGDWDVHSFFGGHAANAFSCASYLAHRFDMGWVEPGVWALATGVAAARTVDDAHWTSDTLIGSAFGVLIGRMIAERHLARHEVPEPEPTDPAGEAMDLGAALRFGGVGMAPMIAPDGFAGVVVSASFRF